MARILLLPFGSAGDVFPFIFLGRLLQARGHEIQIATACVFESAAKGAGLGFIPMGTEEEYGEISADRRIWKPLIGTKVVLDHAVEMTGRYLDVVEKNRDADLLMAPLTAFGARLAREKLGIPLVTVHLQPLVMVSAHETPLLDPMFAWVTRLPIWAKRLLFSLPNPVDIFALPRVKRLCLENGVVPPESIWKEWWDSPDGALLLFPEWFAKPQPDWPEKIFQWGFPLEDLSGEQVLEPVVEKFLGEGEAPVVFTAGSANIQAERFFEVAAEAVGNLGCRAVFVTVRPDQVPVGLPESILTVQYAPFSRLLPMASAFVHHGGVGTMSQGFAAAVPQLVMAMAHDQPDNAARLEKLGAGIASNVRNFTPDRVTRDLARLLGEPEWKRNAEACSVLIERSETPEQMLRWIEERTAGEAEQTDP